jgi:hypothetical protein
LAGRAARNLVKWRKKRWEVLIPRDKVEDESKSESNSKSEKSQKIFETGRISLNGRGLSEDYIRRKYVE